MSSTILAVAGFAVIAVLMYLIFAEKCQAQWAFLSTSIIAAIILGNGFKDIAEWVVVGLQAQAKMVGLICFVLAFFYIENKVGAFDDIVNWIVQKLGGNVLLVMIAGWLVATCSTLDGVAPSTILVTVPAMLPIYKKMKIRPIFLAYQISAVITAMAVVPWSGPNMMNSALLGVDGTTTFVSSGLVFAMVGGYIVGFAVMLLLGKHEIKRIQAGKNDYLLENAENDTSFKSADVTPWQKKIRPINLLLIVFLLFNFFTGIVPDVLCGIICLTLVLVLNFPKSKDQYKAFLETGSTSLQVMSMFMSIGIFVQILKGTGMMGGMVEAFLSIFPESVTGILHIIFGLIETPVDFVMGGTFSQGVGPVLANAVVASGSVGMPAVHATFVATITSTVLCSTASPNLFMMLSMLDGISLKDHTKYSLIPLWAQSVCMMVVLVILGFAFKL